MTTLDDTDAEIAADFDASPHNIPLSDRLFPVDVRLNDARLLREVPTYAGRRSALRELGRDPARVVLTRDEYTAACTAQNLEPLADVLPDLPDADPVDALMGRALTTVGFNPASDPSGPSTATTSTARSDGREDGEDEPTGRFGAGKIADFVTERYELGRSSDGKLVAVPRQGARIARNLDGMTASIAAALYDEKQATPSPTTLASAFGILRGRAAEADPLDVHLRAAYDSAARVLHVDLGDAARTILHVDANGWREAAGETTPIFRRTSSTMPIPTPVRDSSGTAQAEFAALLGLDVASSTFRLLWGWTVAAWFADVPRPILWSLGEQGSGKTTRAGMVLDLVDPARSLGGNPGKNERDDSTSAYARFVPTYDNLRTVPESTSDWICRLVTGVSIDRRALYTDDGVVTSTLMRTGLATSITLPYGLGPDAIERLVLVRFERIADAERRDPREIAAAFAALRPRLVGTLLDDVVGVLRHYDETPTSDLPRMAAYARTLHALDLARGGDFAAAYIEAADHAMTDAVESDPWLSAVVDLAHATALPRGRCGTLTATGWEGTAAELVAALSRLVDDTSTRHPTERGIWGVLKQKATPLRAAGVESTRRKSNGARLLALTAVDGKPEPNDAEPEHDEPRSIVAAVRASQPASLADSLRLSA